MRGLRTEAPAEGFGFVERLVRECRSGANRFDAEGERLLGAFEDGVLLGIGGINQDPYAMDACVVRIRHLYVLPSRRRSGLGAWIVGDLVRGLRPHTHTVRLRTDRAGAATFYERIGFRPEAVPGVSHAMRRR